MPSETDIQGQQQLLAAHRRTLAHYLQQRALIGAANIPPGVAHGIEDARNGIGRIKATLRGWNVPVVDLPDDDPSASADRLFAAMPLDTIPDPAPLPSGSRMPLGRNPLFVGRTTDLQALAVILAAGETAAITGLGGMGKTQLAVEFVHRYGQFFPGGVFWLSFADPRVIAAEVAGCGGAGALDLRPDFSGLPIDDQLRLVQAAWQSEARRLLVFDNCEEETLLTQWRPSSGGCHVLLTSRRSSWSVALGVRALPLGVLTRAESRALLGAHRPDLPSDDADLDTIAEELGDLPLALHLAGSFLETYRDDPLFGRPADFVLELRDHRLLRHPALQGEDVTLSPTNHVLHAGRTFALSYERLDPSDTVDTLAIKLLARAAYFAHGEPIPRDLLLATLALAEDNRSGARQAARGLARLVTLGLLETTPGGALRLHRLMAAFVQETATHEEAQVAVERALITQVEQINATGVPLRLLPLRAHLRSVVDTALVRDDELSARLCLALGYHLHKSGNYTEARPYLTRALGIAEQILGVDHPQTLINLHRLGWLLYAQGDLPAARSLFERALATRRGLIGLDHPDIADSLSALASVIQAQGDFAAARELFEEALAIREQWLGEIHKDTASSLANLGWLFYMQGHYVEARPYIERALAIRKQVLGSDHPKTAESLTILAQVLSKQEDLIAARPLAERALAIYERAMGPDNPDTAIGLSTLAEVLYRQGDYAAARPLLERALAIREQLLGLERPTTIYIMDELGRVLLAQGNDAAARSLYEGALAICEQRLGPDHTLTREIRTKLADLNTPAPINAPKLDT